MLTITLIYVFKPLLGNVVITNEVGSKADLDFLVTKQKASAKVIQLTTAPEAELELAA